ncbi:PREDICTED: uncharacterized protein LOC108804613 [Nanorana parkeri]|uniref:uncharacterized protein LOC108804613 n=1 Tax=Nanorana parkeri TaxID=125878 RepID=UPI000854E09D|nr:PREDICTED: uncharacterized protein LOC108804613 [Nanorana parkeri]
MKVVIRLGDKNFKVPDPADSASFKNGNGCKLLYIVRRDLQLSDSEDSESENAARPSSKKTSKKEREECREKEKTKEDHENEDSAEWAKARKKVEEFLDFPALISAMNFRNKTESSMFSQNSSTSSRQQMACREAAPIPNTRHNAVFLRDNPKAAQVILASPYHNGEDLRTQDKRDGNEDLKGDPPLKKVLNLAEKSSTNMEPETDADR